MIDFRSFGWLATGFETGSRLFLGALRALGGSSNFAVLLAEEEGNSGRM